jgi:D-erythro-7,8-dihydroneopterin triphosphate epimerase
MAILHIKKLFLRSYIGFSEHEIGKLQDVVIDITIDYDASKAESSDEPADALDYKALTKRLVAIVESSHFNLLESMAKRLLDEIMNDVRINHASIEIDKPHALRFADSVSVVLTRSRYA